MDNKYCSTTMDKWSHIDRDEAHVLPAPPPRHKKKVKVSVVLRNTDKLKAVVFKTTGFPLITAHNDGQ